MINLPKFSEQCMYDAETLWHLQLTVERQSKAIAHWQMLERIQKVPGAIIECGVFKGTSFMRLAIMRKMLGMEDAAKLIGFDVFSDDYPTTAHQEDNLQRDHWINTAGPSSISADQLKDCMNRAGLSNYQLVIGDATTTIPSFVQDHPGLRVALINLDIDFYEPTMTALETFYPIVSRGGIILLDNYAGEGTSGHSLHGDTSAVDDFFLGKDVFIERLPFCGRPCFITKR